jgi:hypothetical protein
MAFNVTKQAQRLPAAQMDALAYNGLQVNGGFTVSQFNSGNVSAPTGTATYILDGWQIVFIGTGTIIGRQQTSSLPAGYTAGIDVEATAAITSVANNDSLMLRHMVEGFRAARLGWGTTFAQPLSYGFYVLPSVSGTFFVRVQNKSSSRFFYIEHAVTAGSWQWITGTVPGDTSTSAVWTTDNTIGMYFDIFLMGKSATVVPPSPPTSAGWTATGSNQTTNSTNFYTSTNYVLFTGVTLLPGIELPSAARAPLIMRPYMQELQLCQRYWERRFVTLQANGVGSSIETCPFVTQKRVGGPTMAVLGTPTTSNASLTGFNYADDVNTGLQFNTTVAGGYVSLSFSADARL